MRRGLGPKSARIYDLEMTASNDRLARIVAACVVLSGVASLALEVCWSRSLELVFGSTTLAITTILIAYMLGLALGGWLGGRYAGRLRNGLRAYGLMEIAIGVYAALVPFALDLYPALHRGVLAELGFWPAALARYVLVLLVLLLPTVLMGATLPVLISGLVREREQLADRVSLFYGMNTLGAVLGVLGVTFISLRTLGLFGTNLAAAGLDVAVGIVALSLARGRAAAVEAPAPAPEAALGRWDPVLLSYSLVGFTALACEVAWTRCASKSRASSVWASRHSASGSCSRRCRICSWGPSPSWGSRAPTWSGWVWPSRSS